MDPTTLAKLLALLPVWIGAILATLAALSVFATAVTTLLRVVALLPFGDKWKAGVGHAVDLFDHLGLNLKGAYAKLKAIAVALGWASADPAPDAAKKDSGGSKLASLLFWCLAPGAILVAGHLLSGCAWFGAHETQVATGAADVAVCVLDHVDEPVGQILKDCEGVVEQDVIQILAAHKAAMKRELAGDAGVDAAAE